MRSFDPQLNAMPSRHYVQTELTVFATTAGEDRLRCAALGANVTAGGEPIQQPCRRQPAIDRRGLCTGESLGGDVPEQLVLGQRRKRISTTREPAEQRDKIKPVRPHRRSRESPYRDRRQEPVGLHDGALAL